MKRAAHVLASAHCSARGLDAAAAARAMLAGQRSCSQRQVAGVRLPYFRLPLPAQPWMQRAQAALSACARQLQGVLPAQDWAEVPVFFASSSFQAGWLEEKRQRLQQPHSAADFATAVCGWLGLRSQPWCFSNACTSGMAALQAATTLLAHGDMRHALIIAAELENRLTARGFGSLGLLKPSAPRASAGHDDALVLGEAVAAVLLGSDAHLAAPRAWRVASCELGLDAFSPTGFNPDGQAVARTIRAALQGAGLCAADIGLLALHAAGMPASHTAQTQALQQCFAQAMPPLVSLKPWLGHTLGASALAEATALLACLEQGAVPAVPHALAHRPRHVLLLGMGFGGSVAATVLSRDLA